MQMKFIILSLMWLLVNTSTRRLCPSMHRKFYGKISKKRIYRLKKIDNTFPTIHKEMPVNDETFENAMKKLNEVLKPVHDASAMYLNASCPNGSCCKNALAGVFSCVGALAGMTSGMTGCGLGGCVGAYSGKYIGEKLDEKIDPEQAKFRANLKSNYDNACNAAETFFKTEFPKLLGDEKVKINARTDANASVCQASIIFFEIYA